MVVMDNRILSARDVKKIYVRNGGFDVGEMGMLGVVAIRGVTANIGQMDVEELPVQGRDEISVLAAAFNRMHRSLAAAIKMLEQQK